MRLFLYISFYIIQSYCFLLYFLSSFLLYLSDCLHHMLLISYYYYSHYNCILVLYANHLFIHLIHIYHSFISSILCFYLMILNIMISNLYSHQHTKLLIYDSKEFVYIQNHHLPFTKF